MNLSNAEFTKEYIIKEITITTNNIHIDENILIKSFLLLFKVDTLFSS